MIYLVVRILILWFYNLNYDGSFDNYLNRLRAGYQFGTYYYSQYYHHFEKERIG